MQPTTEKDAIGGESIQERSSYATSSSSPSTVTGASEDAALTATNTTIAAVESQKVVLLRHNVEVNDKNDSGSDSDKEKERSERRMGKDNDEGNSKKRKSEGEKSKSESGDSVRYFEDLWVLLMLCIVGSSS